MSPDEEPRTSQLFDPSTRERANGHPRILISDGFETHESLDVLTFCFENNFSLCRLPSHTSHKLQPCDVSVFSPLKTAHRERVEHLERRGANAVNKEHFVKVAVPRVQEPLSCQNLTTPTTTEGVHNLHRMLEEKLGANNATGDPCLQKFLHATEKAFADRSLLHDENESLLKQNDEKRVRQNAKSTVIDQGNAKIMSYADIVEVQRRRASKADAKKAKADTKKAKADAKKAEVNDKKAKVTTKRKRKVEPVTSTRKPAVQAHQIVEGLSAPCPGRAPVARMW